MRIPWESSAPRREVGRGLAWAMAFLVVIPVQSVLMEVGAIRGVIPNAPLLCLLFFSVQYGTGAGLVAGVVLGYALDVFSAGGGTFYVVAYATLGALSGLVGRVTSTLQISTVVPFLVSASLLLGVAHVVWLYPFDRAEEVTRWFLASLLPQAGYDAALGTGVSLVWRWWFPRSHDSTKAARDFFSSGRFPGSVR